MKKRFTFKCWKCDQTYTLFREITDEQQLFVGCPFCNAEAVVDLKPFRKEKKTIFRGESENEQSLGIELDLPDILPTEKPE